MRNKKPAAAKPKKFFSFSKSIDQVSITLLVPQVTDKGTVEKIEVEHCFKIESLFDAMNAFRSKLYALDSNGVPELDMASAAFALWEETIAEVRNYDLEAVEDWKNFFRINPIAREHAVSAGTLLADQLGIMQGRLSVPFVRSGS